MNTPNIFDIVKYVRTSLLESAELKELVGARVYPMLSTQATTFPFITITKTTGYESLNKSSITGYNCSVAIDIFETNYESLVALEQKVYDAVKDYFKSSSSNPVLSDTSEDWSDDTYIGTLTFQFTLQ